MAAPHDSSRVFDSRYADLDDEFFEPNFPDATAANTAPGTTTKSGIRIVDRAAACAFSRALFDGMPPIPRAGRLPVIVVGVSLLGPTVADLSTERVSGTEGAKPARDLAALVLGVSGGIFGAAVVAIIAVLT